jgi:transposase
MVNFGSTQRYFVYQGSIDMRKSFDGLQGIVVNELKQRATTEDIYIFFNARRTQVKLLAWDRSGFVIYYKRLESGRFEQIQKQGDAASKQLSWGELQMVMEGIELSSIRQRKRYHQQ